jgi:RNA 2',3'-cyclic 3'-phosphodiesterase
MRTFIAIELPEATRVALYDFRELLRRKGMHATWVKPEVMHLTLRFLGDVTAEQASTLSAILTEAYSSMIAPVLLVRGVGVFPSLNKPSILWAGIETLQGNLETLQQAAESGARQIGIAPEAKTFHPHITLARFKKQEDSRSAAQLITPYLSQGMPPEFGNEFRASNVVLFRSTLTKNGPVYKILQEFSLS